MDNGIGLGVPEDDEVRSTCAWYVVLNDVGGIAAGPALPAPASTFLAYASAFLAQIIPDCLLMHCAHLHM